MQLQKVKKEIIEENLPQSEGELRARIEKGSRNQKFSDVIGKTLVVTVSPEFARVRRILDHDERSPIIVFVQIAK